MSHAPLPELVSIGDVLTDLIRTGADTWQSHAGGAGWNVARAAARMGLTSACGAAIGHDTFSATLWAASTDAGLDLRFLQRHAGPPLLAIVHETRPPDYFFIGSGSSDLAFDPSALPAHWETQVRYVHFAGAVSLSRAPLSDTLLALAARLRAQGVRISYDPNYRKIPEPGYAATLRRMAALADVIKVSDEDLHALFDTSDTDAAIAALRALNPAATLFITRGGAAATLLAGDTVAHATPPAVTVADTVGAGDASMAGLLHSLIRHPQRDWPAHLRFAVAAGATACTRAGAFAPTVEDIARVIGSSH
jgi:fructokinase